MVYFLRFLAWFFGTVFHRFHKPWRPGEPIRCLVVGYGGANNTGAEARTDEALKQMLAADDRLNITITALDKERMLRYTKEHDRLAVHQIHMTFVTSLLKLIMRSHILVLIEGSCFKENFSQALFWYFMFAADLAQRFGIPTMTYAVDAGKMRPANVAWGRDVANKMDLVITRTSAAAGVLKEMGVTRQVIVTTDTAFTIVPESKDWVRRKFGEVGFDVSKPVIGIAFEEFFWWPVVPSFFRYFTLQKKDQYKSIYYHTWTQDKRERSSRMKNDMARFAEWAARKYDANIAFFAMERLDAEPASDVMRRMNTPAALFDSDRYNAAQMTAILRNLKFLVTCRYHALVLSMGGHVPVIGLAHDERIETIMDELGLKEALYIHYMEDGILEKLKTKSAYLVQDEAAIRGHIEEMIPSYLDRMASNGRHFAKLVSQKFPRPARAGG